MLSNIEEAHTHTDSNARTKAHTVPQVRKHQNGRQSHTNLGSACQTCHINIRHIYINMLKCLHVFVQWQYTTQSTTSKRSIIIIIIVDTAAATWKVNGTNKNVFRQPIAMLYMTSKSRTCDTSLDCHTHSLTHEYSLRIRCICICFGSSC